MPDAVELLKQNLTIDPAYPLYYAWLDKLARSVQSIDIRLICINMQHTVAFALSKFIRKMPAFETALSI